MYDNFAKFLPFQVDKNEISPPLKILLIIVIFLLQFYIKLIYVS